jgi:hypothetical protein
VEVNPLLHPDHWHWHNMAGLVPSGADEFTCEEKEIPSSTAGLFWDGGIEEGREVSRSRRVLGSREVGRISFGVLPNAPASDG